VLRHVHEQGLVPYGCRRPETQGEVLVRVLDAIVEDGGESFFRNADALQDAELGRLLDTVGIRGNLKNKPTAKGGTSNPCIRMASTCLTAVSNMPLRRKPLRINE